MSDCVIYYSMCTHIVNAQKPIEHKKQIEGEFKNKVTFEKGANNDLRGSKRSIK